MNHSTKNYKPNHGVITNVEFLALAIMHNPGKTGAHYRYLLLKSLGRPFKDGYYVSYFKSLGYTGKRARLNGCYGDTHWVNWSAPGKHGQWFLNDDEGLKAAQRGLKKLKAAGLTFKDLLPTKILPSKQ